MEWKEKYCIGIDPIDNQHKELIDIISKLEQSLTENKGERRFIETLRFLVDYTKFHFKTEEELMNEIDFPRYVLHRELHNNFIKKITEILVNLKNKKPTKPVELLDFLIDWVINHVLDEDRHIGVFIRDGIIEEKAQSIISVAKQDVIYNIDKLKILFKKKLIDFDDFKQYKAAAILKFIKLIKISKFNEILGYLDFFIDMSLISKKEKKYFLYQLLEENGANDILNSVSDNKNQLLIIDTLYQTSLISEEEWQELKTREPQNEMAR